jgi:sulfite reductase alpha subunit-like flavoprotein
MIVWPTNDPALVDEIINRAGAKGEESVKGPNGDTTLREALFRDCRITQNDAEVFKNGHARETRAASVFHLFQLSRG